MASNLKTVKRDESFSWITSEEMATWDILLKARLEAKRCLVALEKPMPKIKRKILEKYLRGRAMTKKAKAYKALVKKRIKFWKRKNAAAYEILVRTCTFNPSAKTVVVENETAEEFINRIILTRIKLVDLGCTYIDKDVHSLGRLKEGLSKDPQDRELSMNLNEHDVGAGCEDRDCEASNIPSTASSLPDPAKGPPNRPMSCAC